MGPVVEQPQYNLLKHKHVEREYRWLYNAPHGLELTVFAPIKMGILTGKYNDMAASLPDSRMAAGDKLNEFVKSFAASFGNKTWQKRLAVVAGLKPIANDLECSLPQLALAWVLKNQNVSSLIMGASRPEQIAENVRALEVAKRLTPDVMARIEDVVQNRPKEEPLRFE